MENIWIKVVLKYQNSTIIQRKDIANLVPKVAKQWKLQSNGHLTNMFNTIQRIFQEKCLSSTNTASNHIEQQPFFVVKILFGKEAGLLATDAEKLYKMSSLKVGTLSYPFYSYSQT